MARNVVDELVVRLTADATRLQVELGKAEAKANASGKKVGASFAAAFKQASQLGLAAATGITAVSTALVTAANKAAAYADEIDKTAIRTRLSRGALQELAFAADQAGVPFTALEANIRAFTGRLAEAERGSAVVAGTFDRLGVSLRDQSGALRDTESLFLDTIEALSGIDNESTRAALAVQAFGEQGSALLPFLSLGASGLDELRAKARELGIVLDDQSIRTLVEYKDQLSAFQQQFGAAGREIATQFLPLLTEGLLPALESALGVFRNLPEPVQRGATALSGLGIAAGAAAAAFRVLGVSLAPLFGPAGLIVAGAGIIATLAFALSSGNNSLAKAAEDGADALAGGDAGTLTHAIGEVAGELEGPLSEKLLAAQGELAETGRIGVQAAQDIERAFAAVLARQGLSRGLLGAFPTRAATGLDLASNASIFGSAAVPGASAAVQARLGLGDLEGALAIVNDSLDTLTSNFTAVDRTVLSALASFRDELAASIRDVAAAEFTPRPTGGGGVRPPPAGAPGGAAGEAFSVRYTGEQLVQIFAGQLARLDKDVAARLNAQQGGITAEGFPQTYEAVQSFLDKIGASLLSDRAIVRGSGLMQGGDVFTPTTSTAMFPGNTEGSLNPRFAEALEQSRADEALRAWVESNDRALDEAIRTSRVVQTLETRARIEAIAAEEAAAANAALQTFTTTLEGLAQAGRSATVARAALLAGIDAGAPSDRGRTRGSGLMSGGDVFVPPTPPEATQGFIDSGAKVRLELERGAQAQAAAAVATKQAIVTAGVQFASDLAGAIKSGSPSGIFGSITAGVGSLIGVSNPYAGIIFSLLGGLFAGLLPDGSRPSEAARAAGANVSGAPAISINLTQNVSLAVASLVGAEARQAFDRANTDLLRLIETNVLPRLGRLEAAA